MTAADHFLGFGALALRLDVVLEGWRAGIIESTDVIDVATQRLALGLELEPSEEALAFMLSDEVDDAEFLLRGIRTQRPKASNLGQRMVTFSRLMAILDDWESIDLPELAAEQLFEEAGDLPAYSSARLYHPLPGARLSKKAHLQRLRDAAMAERMSIETAAKTSRHSG